MDMRLFGQLGASEGLEGAGDPGGAQGWPWPISEHIAGALARAAHGDVAEKITWLRIACATRRALHGPIELGEVREVAQRMRFTPRQVERISEFLPEGTVRRGRPRAGTGGTQQEPQHVNAEEQGLGRFAPGGEWPRVIRRRPR